MRENTALRVAYDIRLLAHDSQPTGVGHYAFELIRAVASLISIHLIIDTPNLSHALPGHIVYLPRRWAWQQLHLPRALNRLQPVVFHSLHSTLPLLIRVPSVVTIHDLAFWHTSDAVEPEVRVYLRRWVPLAAKRATHVITPSGYVKEEVCEAFNVSPDRVTAVHHGVGPPFTVPGEPDEVSPYSWPYVLVVGTLQPRKNCFRLIRAFAQVVRSERSLPHHLVLAGCANAEQKYEIHRVVEDCRLGDRVHLTDYLAREKLAQHYRHASLFAYPSLYEGFGLPLLEAMVCGCPVLTSNSSGMAEVTGGVAILVEPASVESIAEGLYRGLSTDLTEMILAGRARGRSFTWAKTAQQSLQVYAHSLNNVSKVKLHW